MGQVKSLVQNVEVAKKSNARNVMAQEHSEIVQSVTAQEKLIVPVVTEAEKRFRSVLFAVLERSTRHGG